MKSGITENTLNQTYFLFSGTLNFGADADFIMIDIKDNEGKMDILSTWIFGEKVYDSKS